MASSLSFSDNSWSPSQTVYPVGASFTHTQILLIDSRYWAVKDAIQNQFNNSPSKIQPLLNNPLDNYLFWKSPAQPFLNAPLPPDESIDLSINRNNGSSIPNESLQFYLTVKPMLSDEGQQSIQEEEQPPEAQTIQDLRMRPDHIIMCNLEPFCKVCKLSQDPSAQLIKDPCSCSAPALSHIHRDCLLALIHEDSFFIPGFSSPNTSLPRKNKQCPICRHNYSYAEPKKKISCCQRLFLAFLALYSSFLTLLLIFEEFKPTSVSLTLGVSTTFLAIYSALSNLLLIVAIVKISNCRRTSSRIRAQKEQIQAKTERAPSSSSLMGASTSPVKPCLSERIRQRKQMFKIQRVKVLPYD